MKTLAQIDKDERTRHLIRYRIAEKLKGLTVGASLSENKTDFLVSILYIENVDILCYIGFNIIWNS